MVNADPYPDWSPGISEGAPSTKPRHKRSGSSANKYKNQSWAEQERQRKERFHEDFMNGNFFGYNESNYSNNLDPIFKIKRSSSYEDFKLKYKELILEHHPDKGGDASMFIKVKEHWDSIKSKML
jgi:hypothetical protein